MPPSPQLPIYSKSPDCVSVVFGKGKLNEQRCRNLIVFFSLMSAAERGAILKETEVDADSGDFFSFSFTVRVNGFLALEESSPPSASLEELMVCACWDGEQGMEPENRVACMCSYMKTFTPPLEGAFRDVDDAKRCVNEELAHRVGDPLHCSSVPSAGTPWVLGVDV